MHDPAICLLVIGPSSVGKTSASRHLQDLLPVPALLTGIDALFAAVSPRWGGGADGPLSMQGFHYDRDQGPPAVTRIVVGPAGRRMHAGYFASVAALLEAGNHVVVDEMLLDGHCRDAWGEVLAGRPHAIIRLTADLEILEQREALRGSEPGLARGHLGINASMSVDHEIDTSELEPGEVGRILLSLWRDISPRDG